MATIRRVPESAWAQALAALGYHPDPSGAVDFQSADGSVVIEVLTRRRASVRDLRAALTKLAIHTAERERVRHACLLLAVERMTPDRLRREWSAALSILRPAVAKRLALVAVGDHFSVCLPRQCPALAALAETGGRLLQLSPSRELPRMSRSFVVLKVILARWLVGEGPISRRQLGEQAGCSYPTVAKAIDWLGGNVRQHSNRSVELGEFPQDAWGELLARVPSQRARVSYIDRSGQPPDTEALLRRLRRLNPPHVALGGVVAAHHYDPHFDLRGLPRLDVSMGAAGGLDLGFVRRLDPALQEASAGDGRPVLVVHPLQRPATLFVPGPGGGLPIADPVETLLDLGELRLVEQANALIGHLERRPAGGVA
ncbi:MAG: hypothetical protein ACYTGZ_21290 [Planctomycetota bacterium]|jgi:hypothetical protein